MSSNHQGSGPTETEKVHWNPDVSYGAYLEVDRLLSCQRRRSDAHDEMLFIVIHQSSELWLKLCIFEVEAAMERIVAGDVAAALKMLSRVSRIQAQLTQSWSILDVNQDVHLPERGGHHLARWRAAARAER
jgi:tryptophan 2,3-dioxygenase